MGIMRAVRNGIALAGVSAAGGAAFITLRHLLNTPQPLTSGLPGEARIDRRHGGDLYYNVAGPAGAQPLILLHDFYPGASNFEYRSIFSALADNFRVFALDWLGFGMSEHPNIAYTGEFYAHMLTGFVRDVVARPSFVIANGLAANVAVRAAADSPALFERLVLISPEGMAGLREGPTISQTLIRLTQRAMLGIVPYALLSTTPALRWFSNASVGQDLESSSETLHHRYASAHQFGGQYATLALLTGELDLPMRHIFPVLEQPSLIISGEDDPRHSPDEMEDLAILNPRADLDILPGMGAGLLEDHPHELLYPVSHWLTSEINRGMPEKPTPIEPGSTFEVSSVPGLGKVDGDPQMEALAEDSPDVAAAVDQEDGEEDDDPTEKRPTTRAVRRNDMSVSSTRVPRIQDRTGNRRSKGATSASTEPSSGTGNRSRKAAGKRSGSTQSATEQ
jgi:pimeloyl-ACP methyl ester carboxylesterase